MVSGVVLVLLPGLSFLHDGDKHGSGLERGLGTERVLNIPKLRTFSSVSYVVGKGNEQSVAQDLVKSSALNTVDIR